MFPSLVRFDEVYNVYFKCNKKRLVDYPNILNYVRDLYQSYPEGFAATTDMDHIRVSETSERYKYSSVTCLGSIYRQPTDGISLGRRRNVLPPARGATVEFAWMFYTPRASTSVCSL